MLVTIAGASGVLGRALVPRLLERGHRVRALARSAMRSMALWGKTVEAADVDLLAPGLNQRLPALLAGSAAVVHIATAIPRSPQVPGAWEQTARLRTDGTRSLIQAALEASVGYYVQQSVVVAYPDRGNAWIDEQTPLEASPLRAAVNAPLITMEGLVRAIPAARMQWCILRGGLFVGPETKQDETIRQLQQGSETVACDGAYYVSYVHVADMAAATVAALEAAPTSSILNITAEPVRQGDYLDQLARMNGAPLPRRNPNQPCPPSIRCSRQAAREKLGWEPVFSIYRRLAED